MDRVTNCYFTLAELTEAAVKLARVFPQRVYDNTLGIPERLVIAAMLNRDHLALANVLVHAAFPEFDWSERPAVRYEDGKEWVEWQQDNSRPAAMPF
jgi:hypothetical protein